MTASDSEPFHPSLNMPVRTDGARASLFLAQATLPSSADNSFGAYWAGLSRYNFNVE